MAQEMKCTACQVTLVTGDEHKAHYKSDWHRYNLKRKVAGLGPIPLKVFEFKLTQLTAGPKAEKGDAHLKDPDARRRMEKEREKGERSGGFHAEKEPEYIEYEPHLCLFSGKKLSSVEANVEFMKKQFSFFIHDREYLTDLKGLIEYLGEKIWKGGQCIFCNKGFDSREACWSHMIDKGHTRIGIDTDELQTELEPFFDYRSSYKEIKGKVKPSSSALAALEGPSSSSKAAAAAAAASSDDSEEDEDGDEWEDCDEEGENGNEGEGEEGDFDEEVDDILAAYGLRRAELTDTGELRLPDGRTVAHRAIAYVYKQKLPNREKTAAVRLALENGKKDEILQKQLGMGAQHVPVAQRQMLLRQRQKDSAKRVQKELSKKTTMGVRANKLQTYFKRCEVTW
uniref:ZN622/Rei1/Reh1 zinc finger C2H2-type domain-containing protein n=1 Tax=Chromera velia CCMP2878 TaxID=1169474 RepID=A0A0G4GC10_9ALVE|eukprot:Cvel_21108.t1-p1 / transcript=Cvel_21108.t1 / gene=Cvel_21108 / organism=Chromera_velia_CCMP2878 / gene_product=Zinc finger protein 622, putative / transcript_product=Zinc finger protein 622, putative / location=Cvel_scaffold1953:8422-9694(+) / protein_length=396 / sequence_SO=supercontig / SO=protein_coding / is_pseudo=false